MESLISYNHAIWVSISNFCTKFQLTEHFQLATYSDMQSCLRKLNSPEHYSCLLCVYVSEHFRLASGFPMPTEFNGHSCLKLSKIFSDQTPQPTFIFIILFHIFLTASVCDVNMKNTNIEFVQRIKWNTFFQCFSEHSILNFYLKFLYKSPMLNFWLLMKHVGVFLLKSD